jgi:MFS family permease
MAGRLWQNKDFIKLWSGGLISVFGSAITSLALPLIAITTLNAGATEMGILKALGQMPVLLFGFFVGAWVDRVKRRPLMITADFGRAILMAMIPILALLGEIRIEFLYIVVFLTGTLSAIFDLAVTSFLPSVVGKENLIEGNSKIQISHSVASIGGPGLAGVLIQVITAPIALALDALSFLVSAFCLLFIHTTEPAQNPSRKNQNIWREIGEGIHAVFRNPILSPLTVGTTIASLGGAIQETVFLLYLTRELTINPAWIGIILATGGFASLLGAMLAEPITRHFSPGRVLIIAQLVVSAGMGIIPFASGGLMLAIPILILSRVITSAGVAIYSINQISLRQSITPDHLLGRVNACRRVLVFGIIPVGAMLGGMMGETIGLKLTLVMGATVAFLSFLFHFFSPLRTTTDLSIR